MQGIERLIRNSQSSIQTKRIETTALHKNGHTFPIELAMTSLRTDKGWIFNAFIRDLSEQKQNEDKLKLLLGLLEPFMMLFIGVVVGVIVSAMLLPIFTMTQGLS